MTIAPCLRAALVGLGSMGSNHARILADMDGVDLVGVADVDRDRLVRTTRGRTTAGYSDYLTMLEEQRPDFVVIAAPSKLHVEIGVEVVGRGIPALVEKPIASSVSDARLLVSQAGTTQTMISVGHVERFNPAILELRRRLSEGELGKVYQIEAVRVGPFPERIRDVGVVHDLAPHDLDVMQLLLDSPIVRVFAETQRRIHTDFEDGLAAVLRFASGAVGTLTVNWLSPRKARTLSVLGERGQFVVDYVTQDLWWYSGAPAGWSPTWSGGGSPLPDTSAVKIPVEKREPLRMELEAFVRAVRDQLPAPVPADDAIRTLAISDLLVRSAETGESISFMESQ